MKKKAVGTIVAMFVCNAAIANGIEPLDICSMTTPKTVVNYDVNSLEAGHVGNIRVNYTSGKASMYSAYKMYFNTPADTNFFSNITVKYTKDGSVVFLNEKAEEDGTLREVRCKLDDNSPHEIICPDAGLYQPTILSAVGCM